MAERNCQNDKKKGRGKKNNWGDKYDSQGKKPLGRGKKNNWGDKDDSQGKKPLGRGKKNNWGDRDGPQGRKPLFSSPGSSKENSRYQKNTRHPFGFNTNNSYGRPVSRNSTDDIKSNNLLDTMFLNDLVDNQSIEHITTFLVTKMEEYTRTLALEISEEPLIALLKLGAKACENSFVVSKSLMLKNTLQKSFVTTICSFLSGLVVDDNKDSEFWKNFGNVLDHLLILLESAMQFIPMTSWQHIQTIVKTITLLLPILQKHKEIRLNDDFGKRISDLRDDILKIENKFKTCEYNTQNEACDQGEDVEPEDDYRFKEIYPDIKELIVRERPYIRKNIVEGKYASVKQYLDIHFRLMREDFLNPIREDICDYLNNTKRRLFNIKVHRNVIFLEKDVHRDIVCFQIRMEISQALKNMIDTGENKRFMHGTLLFFSKDKFESVICGRVVNTDSLREGTLLVDLPHNNEIDCTSHYSMIECVIFFEPYYRVLTVLQRLSQNNLPMEKYILNVNTNISRPKYIENIGSFVFPPGLNESQIKAMNAALSKEFVIIQGPPGTGKTFLGMTLVKMLLDHKEFWGEIGPILVICYTNHALEQFLDGLSKYTERLVRLGHNSKDLQNADRKYGPMGRLEVFIGERYGLSRDKYLHEYVLSDDESEEDSSRRSKKHVNKFDRDFSRLVYYLGHYPVSRAPLYYIDGFNSVCPTEVPINIMIMLKEKADLSVVFKNLKTKEGDLKKVKADIENVINYERKGIFMKVLNRNNMEYYFQNIELFCWLLCDDGTISLNQNDQKLKNVHPVNRITGQEEIYYLLCNFVMGTDGKRNHFFLSVSALKEISRDLQRGLRDKNIPPAQDQVLREQLDFLLQKIDYLKYCLETDFDPPEVEFNNFTNPFMIQSIHRWQLYKQWVAAYKNKIRTQLEKHCDEYQKLHDTYNDLREMENVKLLRKMDIVGMTTTCAARLRPTLEALKSPIVVVEEAAEVLESHIVTSLTNDCQHLILLGDHQQLRPTTSDNTIEKKYKLGISLFERMVLNNVECHTLNVQHRMRPEISSLITPLFYKELFNHSTVEMYPYVTGVKHPLYFIDHMEPEEPYGDSSKMNIHEAKFLIEFAIYLLNNNYQPEDITILAAYLGQSYTLKKEQEKSVHTKLKKVRISVVDNFQGEENKIILLSLVRSNLENKVGFLSIDNRVCVALSRAKVGLYIMGNMTQLCNSTEGANVDRKKCKYRWRLVEKKSYMHGHTYKALSGLIWKSIRTTLNLQKALGDSLPLRCRNHSDHITFISKPTDFVKVREGGCDQTCNAMLKCGHTCDKMCHGYDLNHELYNCLKPCSKLLCDNETHKCKKLCFEKCGRCQYRVCFQLPCKHRKTLPCFTDVKKFKCMELMEIEPACGHTQKVPCFIKTDSSRDCEQPDDRIVLFKCKEEIEKIIPICGHLQIVPCFEDTATFKCLFEMELALKCGHKTKKSCYLDQDKIKCSFPCNQTLRCGHKCPRKCHVGDDPFHRTLKCMEICTKNLEGCNYPEDHTKFQGPCHEKCPPCTKIIIKSYTTCSHIQKLKCFEAIKARVCDRPCNKKLSCGHWCQKICSELCGPCDQMIFKERPECGHKFMEKCSPIPRRTFGITQFSNIRACFKKCEKVLQCGHKCIKRCSKTCACKQEVVPQCGHTISIKCGENASSDKCEICKRRLNRRGYRSSLSLLF